MSTPSLESRRDHSPNKLVEGALHPPAGGHPEACRITTQRDLPYATPEEIRRFRYMTTVIQPCYRKGPLGKISNGVQFAGCDDIVLRSVQPQHPHNRADLLLLRYPIPSRGQSS